MLATSRVVAVQSVNEQKDRNTQAPQTVARVRTTTTTTTMTNMVEEALIDHHDNDISCAQQQQQQKILLYESTRDETQSALLTDDDMDSVNSSVDSKDRKENSDLNQDTVDNDVDRIDTQMQSLSFMSTPDGQGAGDVQGDDGLQHLSRQLDQLDIDNAPDDFNEPVDEEQKRDSIVSLSSNDTSDDESEQLEDTQDQNDENSVIVLSDSDTEEAKASNESSPPPSPSPPKRIISQEPPLKPASSNDPAMYNISPIDSSSMQRVNNFFDNAPFIHPCEPIEEVENSFNSSRVSQKSQKSDVFIPETSDEESMIEDSVKNDSVHDKSKQSNEKEKSESTDQQQNDASVRADEELESNDANMSDNNIIVDIPVKKSASDQPRQVTKSPSGVRVKASRSSPITKTSSSNNVIIKKPGNCGFTVNSNNGQLNIAAKININIQIVEDSSEDSSEDNNKPNRKSQAIQSSEDQSSNRNTNTSSNDMNSESPKPTQADSEHDSLNTRTPSKNSRLDSVNKTPKTPQTASKLKQFEFVPPKSMTKSKRPETSKQPAMNESGVKSLNKSITSEGSESDGFQFDKHIPISPRDQKLLVRVDCFVRIL